MKIHIKKPYLVVVVCLVVFAALYAWNRGAAGQKEVRLPKVVSEAKNIEVLNVRIDGPHALVVTVRNNSEKPVVAITLQTGDGKDETGVGVAGYQEGDEPDRIVIKPHETFDLDMPLNYLHPNGVVRVGGVIYGDDTGEGDESTLRFMRAEKKQFKSDRPKREGGGPR
ncbi:MAG TPA: hypothetical protein VK422_06370 [Pyrinomonadaceae bacterium]|nr:hypothetical protein [Pyrinomonadaceae bacterium]